MKARNRYRKGADKERRIMNFHRKMGHLAFRSAGSHSPIDVFVLDPECHVIFLIQSKSAKMSEAGKKRILNKIKKYDGYYQVQTIVE